jgi:hypothetical protein
MSRKMAARLSFGPYAGYDYRDIEKRAMLRMSEMELCLLELYAYQSVRDLPIITRRMDRLFRCDFGERLIDGAVYNIRKLVSLKYQEADWKLRWKRRNKKSIDPDEPAWMHWASLAANEERKIRNTYPLASHLGIGWVIPAIGYESGHSDTSCPSDDSVSVESSDSDTSPERAKTNRELRDDTEQTISIDDGSHVGASKELVLARSIRCSGQTVSNPLQNQPRIANNNSSHRVRVRHYRPTAKQQEMLDSCFKVHMNPEQVKKMQFKYERYEDCLPGDIRDKNNVSRPGNIYDAVQF